jgi:SAM-dependent methyltransferase
MMQPTELAWTGERFLPEVEGDIALEHFHRYALARSLAHGKRVLDIACGEGYGASMLAQVATSVIGIDLDPTAVEHARARYKHPILNFRQGSCTRIELPDASIDLAVSFETLEHHAEHDAMLAELFRVLSPSGILVISTPDRLHYSDALAYSNPYHVRELYAEEFYQLIRRHFRHAQFLGQRITYGSLMTPLDAGTDFLTFSDNEGQIIAQSGVPAPLYLIALASTEPLPPVPSSLFDGTQPHIQKMNRLSEELQVARDLLASVHGSLYWQIAEPVRWLRRVLKRWKRNSRV